MAHVTHSALRGPTEAMLSNATRTHPKFGIRRLEGDHLKLVTGQAQIGERQQAGGKAVFPSISKKLGSDAVNLQKQASETEHQTEHAITAKNS